MIITETPLRLSFLGGNTDFKQYYQRRGGAVLTTAIDKYVTCIVNPRFDDEIRVNYSVKEKVDRVADLKHDLVREAMNLVGVKKRIEISFLSDIPSEGSGLGSSSSVTVGVLNALHQFVGENVGAEQLAQEACHIEIDRLGKPIGVQDQYAAAFGGLSLTEFGEQVRVNPLDLPDHVRDDLANSMMLFYTNRTRQAGAITGQMKLDDEILDRNKALAYEGRDVLLKGNVYALGGLMDEYWQLKKRQNGAVSDPAIDKMYDDAMKAGARGGKILGAGGGGFLALMVPEEKRNAVRQSLNLREVPFGFAKGGSKVIFDNRR